MSKYINQLDRKDVTTIFKTRKRMLKVKEDFKNKYPDQKFRMRYEADETQEQILQFCPEIHADGTLITREYEIDSTSVTLNKTAASKITTTIN